MNRHAIMILTYVGLATLSFSWNTKWQMMLQAMIAGAGIGAHVVAWIGEYQAQKSKWGPL
jgi:hypothetical protein